MSRTAISIETAAYHLLERGHSDEHVASTLNALKQPIPGYVYPDDVPGYYEIKV